MEATTGLNISLHRVLREKRLFLLGVSVQMELWNLVLSTFISRNAQAVREYAKVIP
jgi:hypothetical protein